MCVLRRVLQTANVRANARKKHPLKRVQIVLFDNQVRPLRYCSTKKLTRKASLLILKKSVSKSIMVTPFSGYAQFFFFSHRTTSQNNCFFSNSKRQQSHDLYFQNFLLLQSEQGYPLQHHQELIQP